MRRWSSECRKAKTARIIREDHQRGETCTERVSPSSVQLSTDQAMHMRKLSKVGGRITLKGLGKNDN